MNTLIKKFSNKFHDALYLNSILLILTTVAMAGFGFVFWLVNAKLFSAQDIGIATAIIPTTTIIATASLFGLDNSIIRFLKEKKNDIEFIRSIFFFVIVLSTTSSIIFGFVSYLFSPTISDFFLSKSNYLIFILLAVTTTLNQLCDAIYLANRRTIYSLVITTFHSLLRAILPFLFISFGAGGILLAAAVAQFIGLIINFVVLQKIWRYFAHWTISLSSLSGIWKFTADNYVASLFSLLPYSIVPIIILDNIGSAEAAYYYIVLMIANVLFIIPGSVTKSLFAEGSHNEEHIGVNIIKSIIFIGVTTIPCIGVIFLGAEFILSIFGAAYVSGATLLKILSLASIPYGLYSINIALFKIAKKAHYYLVCNAIYAVSEVFLVYYFIDQGLNGIGYATISSNTIAALLATILAIRIKVSGKL